MRLDSHHLCFLADRGPRSLLPSRNTTHCTIQEEHTEQMIFQSRSWIQCFSSLSIKTTT